MFKKLGRFLFFKWVLPLLFVAVIGSGCGIFDPVNYPGP